MNRQLVSVIDIGTTKIVALVGEKIGHAYNILGYSVTTSTGLFRGNVINVIKTSESIKKVVSEVERQTNIKISEVYVGIAGQNIKTKVNSSRVERQFFNELITTEEVQQLKERQFNIPVEHDEEILDVIPKQIILDDNEIYSIEELIGCVGKNLTIKYNIIVAKQQNIRSIEKSIELAGLTLKRIFLEPLASSKAVLYNHEIDKGVVMIDIGGGTTDIAIFRKGMLIHTAVIPFGGMVITQDIKNYFNLTPIEAENLKKNYSQAIVLETDENKVYIIKSNSDENKSVAIDANVLNNVVQARMEEIFGFVENEISTYAGIKDKNFEVVITGGGSLLKHLNQLVKFVFAMDSRIGYPSIYLKKDENNQNHNNFANPQFATAIGLMMLALENYQIKENISDKINTEKPKQNLTQQDNENISQQEKQPKKEQDSKSHSKGDKKIMNKITKALSEIFKNTDSEI